jgi:hypothetical protein
MPVAEIDGVWQFLPLRQGQREFGTAIISRVDGERRRIYTARYGLTIRGKERGQFTSQVEEVGSGPRETLHALLLEVRRRLDEEDSPAPKDVDAWFAAVTRDAPPQP